jgi:DNA-binding NarL/FixJ family response regulator
MAATQPALRVVFAEDNFLVREGTAALLAEVDEIELARMVDDPQSLIKAVGDLSPDAVLTDIRMPPTYTTEGIAAARRIRSEYPGTGVVVLSQYAEPDDAFELLADGVAGLGYQCGRRTQARPALHGTGGAHPHGHARGPGDRTASRRRAHPHSAKVGRRGA